MADYRMTISQVRDEGLGRSLPVFMRDPFGSDNTFKIVPNEWTGAMAGTYINANTSPGNFSIDSPLLRIFHSKNAVPATRSAKYAVRPRLASSFLFTFVSFMGVACASKVGRMIDSL